MRLQCFNISRRIVFHGVVEFEQSTVIEITVLHRSVIIPTGVRKY
jgi:hypothetical protein